MFIALIFNKLWKLTPYPKIGKLVFNLEALFEYRL